MGKKRNRAFDFAKQQEKILKKMAQSLYKKPTDSVYLVITEPFGMDPSPAKRDTQDINRLSSWISWVFRRPSVLEAVYTMSTRDEVIIKISEDLDVTLMLGKHRYCHILNRGWANPDSASCVFEYDYPSSGDPSAHNWREHIALDTPAPPGHFRDPYPAPTWTIRPPELAALAYPLPVTVPRTPSPSPGPSSAGRHDEKGKATVKSPPSDSVKVEPSGNATSPIKSEERAYEPGQALRDEIARLNSSQANVCVKEERVSEYGHGAPSEGYEHAQSSSVKQEPRDMQSETPAIGPSQALLDEWSRLQSQQQQLIGPPAAIKREPDNLQLTTTVQRASGSREHEQRTSFENIKREPTADEDVQPWKRRKTEFN